MRFISDRAGLVVPRSLRPNWESALANGLRKNRTNLMNISNDFIVHCAAKSVQMSLIGMLSCYIVPGIYYGLGRQRVRKRVIPMTTTAGNNLRRTAVLMAGTSAKYGATCAQESEG